MASLAQQLRVIFSGIWDENQEPDSTKGRQVPIQKGQSFREKKGQISWWFGSQIPGLMSSSSRYDPSEDGIFETAVAASAYAITKLEESRTMSLKRSNEGKEVHTLGKILSRKPSRSEDMQLAGENALRKSETTRERKPAGKAPSFKRPTDSSTRSALKPTVSMPREETNKRNETSKSGNTEMKAAAWEIAKLAKIKSRYDKVMKTIRSWEDEEKQKASSRLDRRQEALKRKRERAIETYHDEMNRINRIAGDAKSQAEERRRNEEVSAKKMAKKIRSTGEVPRTCSFF